MRKILVLCALVAVVALLSCTGGKINNEPDPRRVVMKFFGAMQDNDTTALAHYLDFKALMNPKGTDYSLSTNDEPRVFHAPQDILTDLVEGGLTHDRWFSMQRVVGSATQHNDSALVEVSFINKSTNTQYLTKFGLRKIKDSWKIYSFHVSP